MASPRFLAAAVCVSLVAAPLGAQDASLAPTTYAGRGALIGGIAGGLLGGLGLGVLAQGLCEYECDGAFLGGFLYGGIGGGAVGALTGLVIGAAIPRGAPDDERGAVPPAPGRAAEPEAAHTGTPWTVRLAGGPRFGSDDEFGGTDWWMSLSTLRATSTRVRWGVELGYLGHRSETLTFTLVSREGEAVFITNVFERRMWNVSLVAARVVGSGDRPGAYILASAGAYPYWEAMNTTRMGDAPDVVFPREVSEIGTTPYPGVGLGLGGVWRLGSSVGVGFDTRLHLVVGAGDGLGIPLATVGGTVWMGR